MKWNGNELPVKRQFEVQWRCSRCGCYYTVVAIYRGLEKNRVEGAKRITRNAPVCPECGEEWPFLVGSERID